MKRTRRFAAMIAAMALTATMAVPTMMSANATPQEVSVSVQTDGSGTNNDGKTPSADVADHTYTAYEIFKGEWTVKTPAVGTEGQDGYKPAEYEFKVTGFGKDVDWSIDGGIWDEIGYYGLEEKIN